MAGSPRPFLHKRPHPLLQRAVRDIAMACQSYRSAYLAVETLLGRAIGEHGKGHSREAVRLVVQACSAEWELTGDCEVAASVGAELFSDWEELHDRTLDELEEEESQ